MNKCILLPKSVMSQLINDYDVNRVTVNRALTFKSNSVLAEKIRRTAIVDYGALVYQPPLKNSVSCVQQ